MWWYRTPHNPSPYDDDWEDQPKQGPFYQWGLGGVLPALLVWHGIAVMAAQEAMFKGHHAELKLQGTNALAFGIAASALGLFLHCHYFWGNIYNQAWFAVLGKILSACGFIAGLGLLIVRVGVLGRM